MPVTGSFAIDCVSGILRIGDPDAAASGPPVHPLVRALGPALDTAFGLEHAALCPDVLLALVTALDGGRPVRPVEPSAALALECI